MGPQLTPRLLDRSSIDKAYPLVRGIMPNVTLERWTEFAKPYFAARSPKWPRGLMTIQNGEGYILGLFGFEVRDELHSNRTLFIYNIIVPQIPGHDLIWTVVIRTAETLATINGCRTIQIKLADDLNAQESGREWLGSSLTAAGYVIEGVHAFKRMLSSVLTHG
jgi:hypothetical protein